MVDVALKGMKTAVRAYIQQMASAVSAGGCGAEFQPWFYSTLLNSVQLYLYSAFYTETCTFPGP